MPTAVRGLQIRPLASSDVHALSDLSERLGVETQADWQRRVEDQTYVLLGAERDGRLVAYAGAAVRRSFGRPAPTAWVDAFAVGLDERGRGVGRALAVELIERLRSRGARRALTIVPLHDRSLEPFFRELGFRDEAAVCLGRDL